MVGRGPKVSCTDWVSTVEGWGKTIGITGRLFVAAQLIVPASLVTSATSSLAVAKAVAFAGEG